MYIYFNDQGIPTTQIYNGEIVRQNSTFNIYVVFSKSFSSKNKVLTIKFKRPADNDFGTEYFLKELGLVEFNKADDSENSYNLIDGESYFTYHIKIDKNMNLTNDYGNIITLITLYESNELTYNEDNTINIESFNVNNIIIEGKIKIYVEPTLGDSVNNTISPPQYDYLMSVIGNLVKSEDGYYERINVIDNVSTQSSTDALSAKQGYLLDKRISILEQNSEKIEVVDNVETDSGTKALSAKQGMLLSQRISVLEKNGGNVDLSKKADLDATTNKLVLSQLPMTHYVGESVSEELVENGIFYKII